MALFIRGSDLLSLDDLRNEEITEILTFAGDLKNRAACGEELHLLEGVHLFVYDPDQITPAWDPVGLAMSQLGGQARRVDPGRLNLAWSETFYDLFRQLDLTGHGLAMASARPGEGHGFMSDTAELMTRPVLNLLSEVAAPLQSLATLLALRERLGQDLSSATAAVCWAPPGLAFKPVSLPMSLSSALIRWGLDLRLACPLEFHPGEEFHARMDSLVPGALEIVDDPDAAIEGANIVFAMNWGAEAEDEEAEASDETVRRHAYWRLSAERLGRAAPKALVGGHLPQSRDREIEAALLDDPRSIHLEESVNLLHAAKAVLALTLDLSNTERVQHESDE